MRILKTAEAVYEFLELYGFDQIKIPGGTEKHKLHYCGIVVYTVMPSGDVYFLGLPYDSSHHTSCERNDSSKKEGESPVDTALRELFEETGILIESENLTEVLRVRKEGRAHTKYFYLASWKQSGSGALFDFAHLKDGRNPADKETGTPVWLSPSLVKEVLWQGHHRALVKAVQHMCQHEYLAKQVYPILSGENVIVR